MEAYFTARVSFRHCLHRRIYRCNWSPFSRLAARLDYRVAGVAGALVGAWFSWPRWTPWLYRSDGMEDSTCFGVFSSHGVHHTCRWMRFCPRFKSVHLVGCASPPVVPFTKQTVVKIREGHEFSVFQRVMCQEEQSACQANFHDLIAALTQISDTEPPAERARSRVDVVFLGEVHDDPVAHLLQLQILKNCANACLAQGRRLVLSLEMFEADVQRVLDEYVLKRAIREADFLQDARPWGNYHKDYRPLVEFCREKGFRVIAANAPRRYVSLVSREGDVALQDLMRTDGDSTYARSSSAASSLGVPPLPLPPASAAYRQKFVETIASQMPSDANSGEGGGMCPYIGFRSQDVRDVKHEMLQAQQLWDHSMAQSIAQALQDDRDEAHRPLVIHVCGAFHCAHGLGIPEVLPLYVSEGSHLNSTHVASSYGYTERPWLPIDEALGAPRIAPVRCLPNVISVVCWPADVAATIDVVRAGDVPRSLGALGDWTIITDELFKDRPPS